ncbi:MAG TPA: hypothetical protein VNK49_03250 [Anaerolineales bacterium]|nr:hypothetical protein [Anaerolineales bacterium]
MKLTNGTRSILLSLFLLSAATLTFEINLTRLFSVAQFYHFAFMIVSIALLGFGASGTALTLFPALRKGDPKMRLGQLGFAMGVSILTAYLLVNHLPFDSFSIAWDRRQVWILTLHYIALAAPFFFSGMALGFLLNIFPHSAGTTYAINLFGAAVGCVIALFTPPYLGAEGMVTLSLALALLAGLITSFPLRSPTFLFLATSALLFFSLLDLGLRFTDNPSFGFLELRISPYKSLSYALQYPGAQVIHRRWNAFSRVDVVRSEAIHSIPGLSYRYLQPLPPLDGLFIDGDDLSPILQSSQFSQSPQSPQPSPPTFASYLPTSLAFHLRPNARTLILEPRGGLDIFTALALSSGEITAVEINPLIVEAVPIYKDPRVEVHVESERSFLHRTQAKYDVIVLSLTSSFHPVRSGAYTLMEDYRYTVEAFTDALSHLTPGGLLIATRWLQDPPSEDLRLFALAVTALERKDVNPREQLVAFRGFNTATILLKNGAFSNDELVSLRAFLAERAFDLTYAPNVHPAETNQYNILPESKYYQTYLNLLETSPREKFYDEYDYDIRPPTDDHPFFGHYFKWAQAPQVIAEFGRAWQPFGGAGYFVVVALLVLAILLAAGLILFPVAMFKRSQRRAFSPFRLHNLVYFGLLGLAFLLVEIPLLQRFILYLGNPAYAFTVVLFSLLFFSGLGSRWSDRVPLRPSLAILVILILLSLALLPRFFALTLGLPLTLRLGLTLLVLSPLGFLMGIPFPAGIRLIKRDQAAGVENEAQDESISWVWAVNGAMSVVSSIFAALLALTFGFSWVLKIGALCYAGAWIMAPAARHDAFRRRDR